MEGEEILVDAGTHPWAVIQQLKDDWDQLMLVSNPDDS